MAASAKFFRLLRESLRGTKMEDVQSIKDRVDQLIMINSPDASPRQTTSSSNPHLVFETQRHPVNRVQMELMEAAAGWVKDNATTIFRCAAVAAAFGALIGLATYYAVRLMRNRGVGDDGDDGTGGGRGEGGGGGGGGGGGAGGGGGRGGGGGGVDDQPLEQALEGLRVVLRWGENDDDQVPAEGAALQRRGDNPDPEFNSFTGDIHPMVPTTKAKFEKESMKATHKFCKDEASPVQNFKDLFSKFEYEKETLLVQDELLGINVEDFLKKMVQCEGILKNECTKVRATHELHTSRISKDDNSFSILRKSIGSFLVRDDEV